MSRRMIIAAVLVAAAVTVGIIRAVSNPGQDSGPPPSTQVTTAPAPAVTSTTPAVSRSLSMSPAEPVDEGAGEESPFTGAGRDAGSAGGAGGDDPNRRYWEPVATGFGRAFTTLDRGDTTTTWQARLHPYVTAAVDRQLATIDVANVPRGQFDGLDVLDASDEQVTVQATYRPGWALVLYLISDGNDHWKVYRYDRLEQ